MQQAHVPQAGSRYWVALPSESVFGANTGDFVARYLHLGHAGGLGRAPRSLQSSCCWSTATVSSIKPIAGWPSSSSGPRLPTSPISPHRTLRSDTLVDGRSGCDACPGAAAESAFETHGNRRLAGERASGSSASEPTVRSGPVNPTSHTLGRMAQP
jgi:hypothetical protein